MEPRWLARSSSIKI